MKFAICNEVFEGWDLESAINFAAKAGYDAIEIAPFTMAQYVTEVPRADRERARRAALRAGLTVCGIHWVLAKTEGLHLTSPDPAIRGRTADYLKELVNFCADLGGAIIVFGSPKQRSIQAGTTAEQARVWAKETLAPAVALARDRSVTICLEPLGPAETNFINTAAEAIDFVRQCGSEHFKIILDAKAMSTENRPQERIIRESWPHFAHFHANDPNLKGPGFGRLDFKPIAAALKEVGYQGYVSVEVFNFDEGPEVIATRSIEYLRECFG
jgi:sugar phosphate isomerase/epimerase